MVMVDSNKRPLELIFIPFVIPSHIIPLFETARLFAARGQRVTILTIPAVAASLQTTVHADVAAGHPPISIHALQLPPGGEGLDSFHLVTDMVEAHRLFLAFLKLRPEIQNVITTARPDCVVSDMFYPWSASFCASLGIPRILFHVSSVIQLCLEVAISNPESPHLKLESDDEPFVIPGVPDSLITTRAKLPEFARDPSTPSGLRQQYLEWKEAELNSYGILVNSFYELESAYTDHYEKVVLGERVKVINIGPVALIPRSSSQKAERVYKAALSESECLSWLNSKEPNSVIYVSFGSTCSFTDEQLMEIAFGLESSGENFIWVVHGKNPDEAADEKEKWLPRDFEEMRVKGRGLIVKGWAPQVIILEHGSVGGFLCHCGWNSLTEAVAAGLPMVTWPIHSEQFYNERLATQVLGIAVEVGAEEWSQYSKGRLVTREKIERAIRKLLDGGDEGVKKMREKVKQLQETAKGAVLEGGSSYNNLTVLIEDLMKIRDEKSG